MWTITGNTNRFRQHMIWPWKTFTFFFRWLHNLKHTGTKYNPTCKVTQSLIFIFFTDHLLPPAVVYHSSHFLHQPQNIPFKQNFFPIFFFYKVFFGWLKKKNKKLSTTLSRVQLLHICTIHLLTTFSLDKEW